MQYPASWGAIKGGTFKDNRNEVGTSSQRGSHVMQELLESEGIEIVDDQIQSFDKVFWSPGKELG